MRCGFWITALVAVLNPDLVQAMAIRLRIGRGADFLLYLMALCFPVACFYFLHSIEKQRQQLTRLVRELAQKTPLHQPRQLGQTTSLGDQLRTNSYGRSD
jgi:hypothetical protein